MAEYLPGVLQSILDKVTGNLTTTLAVAWNLEAKRKQFEMQLLAVQSVVGHSESICWRKPSVKELIKKAQAVIEEADEVVEDFIYNAQYAEVQHDLSWSKKALMAVNQSKPFLGPFLLSRKLENTLKKLKDTATILRDAGLGANVLPSQATFTQKTDPDDEFMEIVGRQDATNSLVQVLLAQKGQRKIEILPIVGIGGVGKTALATLIYNDLRVEDHFAVKAWHYCGDYYDICFVLKSLIEFINNEKWNEGQDFPHLKEGLAETISHRRMLLVLDEYATSDSQFESKLQSALRSSCGPGSCILVTSRSIPVSSEFNILQPYQLQSLNQHDAWEIFSRRAFSDGQERPEFVALGREIVKLCNGLPLAVKVISGLMRTKKTLTDWEIVAKAEIKDNAQFSKGVLELLFLSYSQLSSEEKRCFLLTSLFPKGSEIDSEKLIQLWAANCFLLEEQGYDVDTKGSLVLSSFVAKGFLQDMKLTNIGGGGDFKVLTVKMHDFFHDLAKSISDECATSENLLANRTSVEDVRHLIINIGAFQNERFSSLLRDMKSVKTSIIATVEATASNYHDGMGEHCKQLRMKSLRALQIAYAPHLHRHLICSLHLRYLDLSYLPLVEIPDSLCRLYSLQTLRLVCCKSLVCLPEGLANLKYLEHIYNLGCEELKWMPPNLSRLTRLRTMTVFVPDDQDGRGIEELEELNKLSHRLELWNLERVESSASAKKADLGKKTQVTDLVLKWSEDKTVTEQVKQVIHHSDKLFKARASVANNHCDIMMALEPHQQLSYLQICGYGAPTAARWTRAPRHFQHLKKLSIVRCPWLDEIPAVWFSYTLEELTLISIHCLSTLSLVSGKGDSNTALPIFPGLKKLILSGLPNFKIWAGNHVARYNGPIILPKLEDLLMVGCFRVANIPQCPALKRLVSTGCPRLVLSEMDHLNMLQEISYGCTAWPHFRMHIDSWPALHTLGLYGILDMKLLPAKNGISHQRDPTLLRSAHKLISKSVSGQSNEHEIMPEEQKPELDKMEIVEKCFKNLEHLRLSNCFSELLCLPQEIGQMWRCFSHVKSLQITSRKIVAWPAELHMLTSLKRLHFEQCAQLTGMGSNSDEVFPHQLLELIIEKCHSLVKLPHLPSSLEELTVEDCNRVEFFSDDFSFPSLQKLQINRCPRLQDLCVSGQKYYDAISHVPKKEIEIVTRKTPWFSKSCSSIQSCLVV